MKHAFERFGKASNPHPLNHAIQITDGEHVLMSKYAKTDEKVVIAETVDFIRKAAGDAIELTHQPPENPTARFAPNRGGIVLCDDAL